MNNTWKRIIALILAMAMSLSLISANVWAAEEPTDSAVSAQSSEELSPEEEPSADKDAEQEEAAPEEEPPAEEAAPTEEESSAVDEPVAEEKAILTPPG